jgi:hypothetical protein
MQADLVVDASGRGSRTPLWLGEFGYQPPAQYKVKIGLGYATRIYRLRPGAMNGDQLILTVGTPGNPRTAVLAAIEHGYHMVTLAGICGDYPPTDPAGFADFVSSLPTTDIAAALAGAEPLEENAVPFRFPASTRNCYERLREFPDGLLVIGDAVCSFKPVYGQGMTVAAKEAFELRRFLASDAEGKPQRFFAAIAAVIDVPWDIAVGGDLAFPQVPGPRPAKVRFVNAYLTKLHAAAAHDGELARSFVRVVGLKDRPEGLLRPDRALRVLRGPAQTARPAPAFSPDRESVADSRGARGALMNAYSSGKPMNVSFIRRKLERSWHAEFVIDMKRKRVVILIVANLAGLGAARSRRRPLRPQRLRLPRRRRPRW